MIKARMSGTFRLVSVRDAAIDHDRSRIYDYARHRDLAMLVAKLGEQFSVYHCEVLTHAQALACREAETDARRHLLAFQYGVKRIENFSGWTLNTIPLSGGSTMLGDESLVGIPDEQIDEIGKACLEVSTFTDPFGGRLSLPRGQPPPMPPILWTATATASPGTPKNGTTPSPDSAADSPPTPTPGSDQTSTGT